VFAFLLYTASATKHFLKKSVFKSYAENSEVLFETEQTQAYSFLSRTFSYKGTKNHYLFKTQLVPAFYILYDSTIMHNYTAYEFIIFHNHDNKIYKQVRISRNVYR
jgi:hypothetical protein